MADGGARHLLVEWKFAGKQGEMDLNDQCGDVVGDISLNSCLM